MQDIEAKYLYARGMKEAERRRLLVLDALINLVLGTALLVLPRATIDFFGLPAVDSAFYVTVLGAVLFGIGIALLIQYRMRPQWTGLGLEGAVVINLLGAGTVLVWLILDPFELPVRGYFVLWAVVVSVFGTAVLEILAMRNKPVDRRGG